MDASWRTPTALRHARSSAAAQNCVVSYASAPLDNEKVMLWTASALQASERASGGSNLVALGGLPVRIETANGTASGEKGGDKPKSVRQDVRSLCIVRVDKLRGVAGCFTNREKDSKKSHHRSASSAYREESAPDSTANVTLTTKEFAGLDAISDPRVSLGQGVTDLSWAHPAVLLAATPRGSVSLLRTTTEDLSMTVEQEYRRRGGTKKRAVAVPGKTLETTRAIRVAGSPLNARSFVSLENLSVLVWDVERNDRPLMSKKGSYAPSEAITWNPNDPNTVCLGGHSKSLKVLDLRGSTASKVWEQRGAHLGCIRDIAWSPLVPHWVASCGDDACVNVFDLRFPGRPVLHLQNHTAPVLRCAWSPVLADTLLSCGSDRKTILWSANLPTHSTLYSAKLSPQTSLGCEFFSLPAKRGALGEKPFVEFLSVAMDGNISVTGLSEKFFEPLIPRRTQGLSSVEPSEVSRILGNVEISSKLLRATDRIHELFYFRRTDLAVPYAVFVSQQLAALASAYSAHNDERLRLLLDSAISLLDRCEPFQAADPLSWVTAVEIDEESESSHTVTHPPTSIAAAQFLKDVQKYSENHAAPRTAEEDGINPRKQRKRDNSTSKQLAKHIRHMRLRLRVWRATASPVNVEDLVQLIPAFIDVLQKHGPRCLVETVDERPQSGQHDDDIFVVVHTNPQPEVALRDLLVRIARCLRCHDIAVGAGVIHDICNALMKWFSDRDARAQSITNEEWWLAVTPAVRIMLFPTFWDNVNLTKPNMEVYDAIGDSEPADAATQLRAWNHSFTSFDLPAASPPYRLALQDSTFVLSSLKFVQAIFDAAAKPRESGVPLRSYCMDVVRASRAHMPPQTSMLKLMGESEQFSDDGDDIWPVVSLQATALFLSALWKSLRYDQFFIASGRALCTYALSLPKSAGETNVRLDVSSSPPLTLSQMADAGKSAQWFAATSSIDLLKEVSTPRGSSGLFAATPLLSEWTLHRLRGYAFVSLQEYLRSVIPADMQGAEAPPLRVERPASPSSEDPEAIAAERRKAAEICIRMLLASSQKHTHTLTKTEEIVPTNISAHVSAAFTQLTNEIEADLQGRASSRFSSTSSNDTGTIAFGLLERIDSCLRERLGPNKKKGKRLVLRKKYQKQVADLEARLQVFVDRQRGRKINK